MALTELRTWVGLTSDDAVALFGQRVEIEPHWGGRWGLKPSATEVRTCSSRRVHFQQYVMLHSVPWEWMQAILRAHQSDAPGGSAKELEAHEVVFTAAGVLNLMVS
jgi:hypothetical protein